MWHRGDVWVLVSPPRTRTRTRTADSLAGHSSQPRLSALSVPHSRLTPCAAFLEIRCFGSFLSLTVTCFCLERFEDFSFSLVF